MFLADAYLHTLDPFAIRFSGEFGVRWYGVSYAVGFIIAWMMVRWVARRPWSPIPAQRVGDLMFAVIVGVLLGGRLGYAIFYEPHLFTDFSTDFPWWGLLTINKGGMASHGGMIGVIVAVWVFGRRHRVPMLHILDVATLACAPGLFLGRIANFINAELWGRALPDSMQSFVAGRGLTGTDPPWWSVKYPQEITSRWLEAVGEPERHAPHIVAAAQQRLEALEQQLGALIHDDAGAGAFFRRVEQIAADSGAALHDQVVSVLKPLLTAYYPSQIIQAITDGPILLAALALIWMRPRKPGVVGSWFLIIYGLLRIASEVFREPDAGVALTFGWLSRGQTLSVLMILAGFVCLSIASRRDAAKLGGLFADSFPRANDTR